MSGRLRSDRLRVALVLAVFWWAQFLPATVSAGCVPENCEAGSCSCVGFCWLTSEVLLCEYSWDCLWDYCLRMRCYSIDGGWPDCNYICCEDDFHCCSWTCGMKCPGSP